MWLNSSCGHNLHPHSECPGTEEHWHKNLMRITAWWGNREIRIPLCCHQPGCGHVAEAINYFTWNTSISWQVFLTLPRLQLLLHWQFLTLSGTKSYPRTAVWENTVSYASFLPSCWPSPDLICSLYSHYSTPFRASEQIIRNDANAAHFVLGQSDKLRVPSKLSHHDAVTIFS